MSKSILKIGDRIKVASLNLKGTVDYIDHRHLFSQHLYPIQVLLDEEWDPISSVQRVYRTNLKDVRKLRKKVKK